MGDNANTNWEWHNTEVGHGYQAKGVYRQPSHSVVSTKIIDMRGPSSNLVSVGRKHDRENKKHENTKSSKDHGDKKKKSKAEKKLKKSKKKKSKKEEDDEASDDSELDNSIKSDDINSLNSYNPLLQLFMSKFNDD